MTPEITCCFTGHRPQRLPWGDNEADLRCQAVKARLTRAVAEAYDRGYRHFLCGMAQGADLYFCQAVLHLKAQHPGVTLEAAIPYEEIFEKKMGFTTVEDATKFVKESECDWLSVAVGSVHGAIAANLLDKKKPAAKPKRPKRRLPKRKERGKKQGPCQIFADAALYN